MNNGTGMSATGQWDLSQIGHSLVFVWLCVFRFVAPHTHSCSFIVAHTLTAKTYAYIFNNLITTIYFLLTK